MEKDQFDDTYDDIDVEVMNNEMSQSGRDDYGFFDPDRPQEHKQYDIGYDMGLGEKYATEVDCSTVIM